MYIDAYVCVPINIQTFCLKFSFSIFVIDEIVNLEFTKDGVLFMFYELMILCNFDIYPLHKAE